MDQKVHMMCSKNNHKSPRFYTYHDGSEGEESEQNLSVSTKHASLSVNHQGSQCSISSNEMDNMHSMRNEVVSRLSDSDPDNHNHHVHSPHDQNKFHHAGKKKHWVNALHEMQEIYFKVTNMFFLNTFSLKLLENELFF